MCLRMRRQLVVFHGAINAQQLPFQDSTCHLDIIIDTNTYAAMLHFHWLMELAQNPENEFPLFSAASPTDCSLFRTLWSQHLGSALLEYATVATAAGASSRQAHQTISVAQKLLQQRASDAQTGQFQAKIHQCMPLNMPTQGSWGPNIIPPTSQLKIPLRTRSFSSFNVLFSHWCLTLMTPFNFQKKTT